MKTLACGICSTDIDRRFLPFDLPQVIGHEVIAQLMSTKERVAVEINDTPVARGEQNQDPFCREGIHTHSPGRLVLGIDRLPNGFAPYLLAPVNAIVPLKGLDDSSAVLIEPFAAALQAVKASPPQNGDEVAVLGPRTSGYFVDRRPLRLSRIYGLCISNRRGGQIQQGAWIMPYAWCRLRRQHNHN